MSYPPEEKKLINFNALSSFTGGNNEFSVQLITAFMAELAVFETHINESLTEDEFLAFRKAYHSISPSLQMLEISELIAAIEHFKIAYNQEPANLPSIAENIRQLLIRIKEEVEHWQKS